MADLRWENFGVKSEEPQGLDQLRLSVPRTTSLLRFVELSECGGLPGLNTLCLQSAGILNHVLSRIFDDWELLVQADSVDVQAGKSFGLDLGRVHYIAKRESVPDYISGSDSGYVSYPLTFGPVVSGDLRKFAQGLELKGADESFEVGMNLRNLQLNVLQKGGRLLLRKNNEHEEIPLP